MRKKIFSINKERPCKLKKYEESEIISSIGKPTSNSASKNSVAVAFALALVSLVALF
jgi:hypothetical protein